ncbi:MAG TPA: UDP-N-acetylmuramoyl-tripeptide--D-alanyl-D-alanine ligase [Anaerohalosphaeraceae bacterium]|nr:UDP-N-acetylmuramoyl-tripeptide--D-alanyl-D-alanine ligase [Anaerohalosphaeraceae bacterium]
MDRAVAGVSIDSRTLQPGECFFAVPGERFDGHAFLKEAEQKGAACVVVQKEPLTDLKIPVIRVEDTVRSLGRLAAWYRRRLKTRVIAITGSVGKTTTRHLLHCVLSRRFRCRQAPKSFNNQIGVPLTLLSAQPEDEILLVEIGMNHPGEIAPLSRMACPDIAVITHIAPAHLEGMGSVAAIIQEKASILEGLASDGKVYINGDIADLVGYIRQHYSCPIITVGEGADCTVRAERMHSCGTNGLLQLQGQTIRIPLAGMASLRNCLMVWAVCRDFGIGLSDFAEAIKTAGAAPMRLQVEHIGPLTVLNDCYNANPASMENAVDCLVRMAQVQGRRSVFIAGDMLELGAESESLHRQLGKFAAEQGVVVLLSAGRFAQVLAEGAARADNHMGSGCVRIAFGTVESLCNNLHFYIRPDDIILVKASRSVRLERVVERLRELFGGRQSAS